MSSSLTRIALFFVVLLTTACVTTSTRTQPVDTQSVPAITSSPNTASPSRPEPVIKPVTKKVMPAVSNMMRQCRQSVSQGRWQDAIANAERGLRIDRREPYFYWTLAVAYQQLGNMPQARGFANQGLRYTEGAQPLADELRAILNTP